MRLLTAFSCTSGGVYLPARDMPQHKLLVTFTHLDHKRQASSRPSRNPVLYIYPWPWLVQHSYAVAVPRCVMCAVCGVDMCAAPCCDALCCAVLCRLLESQGIPLPVAQWLGTSLAPGGRFAGSNGNSNNGSNGDQKLDWIFDIQGAAALYNSYRWGRPLTSLSGSGGKRVRSDGCL